VKRFEKRRPNRNLETESLRLQLQGSTKAFKLQLRFTKSRVDRDEVIAALQEIIKELRAQS
jgi:hypothetical protein